MKTSIQAAFTTASLKQKKGSSLTRKALHGTFKTLERIAKKGGWNLDFSPENITLKQLQKYVQVRIAENISARTIQNEISHIKRAIIGGGRSIDAKSIFSNKNLGVPSATRIGTGVAIPSEIFEAALKKASIKIEALMRLQYFLGLRMEESVASISSLQGWKKILTNGGSDVTVCDGTKGGRIRAVHIHPTNIAAALHAVILALSVTNNGREHFFPDAKNDASAKTCYGQELALIGLEKETSSHSMRRAFAVNNFKNYLKQGFDAKSSLSRVALDIGHGDKRGRWVWNNYIMNSIDDELRDLLRGDKSMRLSLDDTEQSKIN